MVSPADRRSGLMRRGAYTAWLMWSVPAALFVVAFFHRNAPGVMAKDLMQTFGVTGAVVGLVSATYFYSYAGFMVPAGLLLDAFGARRVVAVGGVVMGLGTIVMGGAAGTSALFVGRFAVGLGATVTFIGALKIAAAWFPAGRFAFISAVTATVGLLGGLVASLPLAALMVWAGWRGAFWIIGSATLAGSLLCWLVVRDDPRADEAAPPRPSVSTVLRGLRRVLANADTWPPFAAFFCFYVAIGNLFLWTVPFLRDVYGVPATGAAGLASLTSIALVAGAPLTGFVSDSVVRRRKAPYVALSLALFAIWACFVATLGALPIWAVGALLFAMGLFGGAFVLTWPIGREVNPPELAGVAVAVVNLGGFLGAALSQGPFGAMLDAHWTGGMAEGARAYSVEAYRGVFGWCTAFVGGSAVISLFLRETGGRNVWATSCKT
jgi:MFS family permease